MNSSACLVQPPQRFASSNGSARNASHIGTYIVAIACIPTTNGDAIARRPVLRLTTRSIVVAFGYIVPKTEQSMVFNIAIRRDTEVLLLPRTIPSINNIRDDLTIASSFFHRKSTLKQDTVKGNI
jgi:hypothetical protein